MNIKSKIAVIVSTLFVSAQLIAAPIFFDDFESD
jgi:hypothetical protein